MSDALRRLLDAQDEHPVITPHLGVMTLRFQVYACADVKAKRRAFAPLKTVWGKEPDLAVVEIGDEEALETAIWSIAALGTSSQLIQQRLNQVEKAISQRIDAPVLDVQIEML